MVGWKKGEGGGYQGRGGPAGGDINLELRAEVEAYLTELDFSFSGLFY